LVFKLVEIKLMLKFLSDFPDDKTRAWMNKTYPGFLYQDYAQGWRLDSRVGRDLALALTGAPESEEADGLVLDLGYGGECEGDASCRLSTLDDFELWYLKRHPQGVRSAEQLKSLNEMLSSIADESPPCNDTDVLGSLKNTKTGLAALPKTIDTKASLATIAKIEQLAKRPAAKCQ
jgi:hypothetical protein